MRSTTMTMFALGLVLLVTMSMLIETASAMVPE
jgi:hypothetical protein